ncbi:hypothetical protein ABZP36_004446 [Zizania latifolia]
MHTWTEHAVATVIGSACSVHYFEEYSRRNNYSKTYDLWAWCRKPEDIAKTIRLSISNSDPLQASADTPFVCVDPYDDSVEGPKLAHTYRILIHVEKLEDFTHASRYGRSKVRSYEWPPWRARW